MAYDRPSPKLLSFLAKHYRLTDSVPQVGSGGLLDWCLVPGLSSTGLRQLFQQAQPNRDGGIICLSPLSG